MLGRKNAANTFSQLRGKKRSNKEMSHHKISGYYSSGPRF